MKLWLRISNGYWRMVEQHSRRRAERLEAKRDDLLLERSILETEHKHLRGEAIANEQKADRLEAENTFIRTMYGSGYTYEEITGGTQ